MSTKINILLKVSMDKCVGRVRWTHKHLNGKRNSGNGEVRIGSFKQNGVRWLKLSLFVLPKHHFYHWIHVLATVTWFWFSQT